LNAARDIRRLIATMMVLVRVFGWSRASAFARCSMQLALRATTKLAALNFVATNYRMLEPRIASAAEFALQVRLF